MNKAEVCALIKELAIIPAIRVSNAEDAHFAAEAITKGCIPIVDGLSQHCLECAFLPSAFGDWL